MRSVFRFALIALLAVTTFAAAASPASAAGRVWGGTGFNDLGDSYITFKVTNGRAKITSLQIIMSCRDTEDGTYSDRAFHLGAGDGATDVLNLNRFSFRFNRYSGGREGTVRVNGRFNSNGRGFARVDVRAVGRQFNPPGIIERCQASSNIQLRRGPVS